MAGCEELKKALASCPDWVAWLAQDADGTWWGYEVQPLPHDTGWYENEVGRNIRLCPGAPPERWDKSLRARSELP